MPRRCIDRSLRDGPQLPAGDVPGELSDCSDAHLAGPGVSGAHGGCMLMDLEIQGFGLDDGLGVQEPVGGLWLDGLEGGTGHQLGASVDVSVGDAEGAHGGGISCRRELAPQTVPALTAMDFGDICARYDGVEEVGQDRRRDLAIAPAPPNDVGQPSLLKMSDAGEYSAAIAQVLLKVDDLDLVCGLERVDDLARAIGAAVVDQHQGVLNAGFGEAGVDRRHHLGDQFSLVE